MNLVIAGGGVKAYAAIGALRRLEQDIKFDKIAGVSAGSILATLIALGCDSYSIQNLYDRVDLSKYVLKYNNVMTYIKILYKKGIYSIEEFRDKTIFPVLEDACNNGDITFREIYERYGKVLVISGSCITSRETHYYHYVSNPDMKVKEAIAISCCVPFMFTPVKWKTDTLVDGGLIENYPLYIFNDINLPNSKVSVVRDSDKKLSEDTIGIKFSDTYLDSNTDTLLQFIKNLVYTMLTNNEKKYMRNDYWQKTIMIETGEVESVSNLNLSIEKKQNLLGIGYSSANSYYTSKLLIQRE
jgi:NTE family protein